MKQKVVNISDIKVANDLPFVLFGEYERAGVTPICNAHLAKALRNRYRNGYSLRVQGLF